MLPRATIPDLKPTFVVQSLSETYDWGLRDLHIPQIHAQTMGEGIKVGIIDSGKSEHFEVQHRVAGFANFTSDPSVNDGNSHSTFVSGIIAAEKNNEGIIGVAPKARLYFAKGLDNSGSGAPASLVNSVIWCIQQKVDIISISAGMFFDFKPLHNAIKDAYRQNITIIAAAGNSGERYFDVAFPARYKEVIGVAAYDKNHNVAPFSSRGINVSFAMPGVDIYSTYLNNQYARESGTSFACPIMSGIIALILSKHRKMKKSKTPCETPLQVLEHLKKYAVKLGDPKETGYGVINTESMFSLGM